ncbi:hypothetical protein SESBI_07958 [Sesbania bispinosa]|nr:hypothetical protein SESBI_07958 [Sesbania bispinosa]
MATLSSLTNSKVKPQCLYLHHQQRERNPVKRNFEQSGRRFEEKRRRLGFGEILREEKVCD